MKGEMASKYMKKDGTETELSISIWDLGGQKVFYTLHHLFLTECAVYLLVFSMEEFIKNEIDSLDFNIFF